MKPASPSTEANSGVAEVQPLPSVVVSAGTKNFHLLMTAEEIHGRGALNALLCGPYPTGFIKRVLSGWVPDGARRLLDREVCLPDALVHPIWGSEVMQAIAFRVRRLRGNPTESTLFDQTTLNYYHRSASRILRQVGQPRGIYHYRAAFGGASVQTAKELGMVTICDHSLADPRLLPSLVQDDETPNVISISDLDPVSRAMCIDIEQADLILVNSEFVRETLVTCGVSPDRIHVNYLGVDEAFVRLLASLPGRSPSTTGMLNLLFAGFFGQRKGADVLLDALAELADEPWKLTIAGKIDPRVEEQYGRLFERGRVVKEGTVSRSRLTELMSQADLFVLPSRAEGSARVLFEAMACGCPVLTTHESGTIARSNVHGFLVRRNAADEIVDALRHAMQDRQLLLEMGNSSRSEVLENYRQSHYGDRLMALYGEVCR
ncbi:MAG: glycosyltransferase family 4 protein [Methanoregulaceae archaeon]|nr:glycosyltransferase family 4 protein [Methanoregulaceae archaeon]